MINPFQTRFAAIFQNEVRLNSKRVAPYVMFLLCSGNGLLWWGWGPATGRGWAINADFVIAGALPVYSFMTLPLFTALFMADPVIRDFRAGVDPLIFSKPISRAAYLLGKFLGNFFVLVCCQSAFVLTWFVLQAVPKQGVVTQDAKVFPYIKHFLVFVVISHLALAAFYFAVGALTRNAKIVYGLGVCFYPVYITYQTVILKGLPPRWRFVLDPLVMNRGNVHGYQRNAEWLNQLKITYDADLIFNRALMLTIAALILTVLYRRFTTAERSGKKEAFSTLNLSTNAGEYFYDPPGIDKAMDPDAPGFSERALSSVQIPQVTTTSEGLGNNLKKLTAALGIEFRLLFSERSLLVIMPLAAFFSTLEVMFWRVTPEPSYSAAYATNPARSILLFLIGIPIFYIGEAIHRDRDFRVDALLWSQPIPNYVLLLAKFFSTLLLMLGLIFFVEVIAMLLQVVKGNSPLELFAYLKVCSLILIPNAIFLAAASLALHVLLRNRYLAYATVIGVGAGLFYLYAQGYNDSTYNPLLYQLWDYPHLVSWPVLKHRAFVLLLSAFFIAIAHLAYARQSPRPRRAIVSRVDPTRAQG
jgi:ABC-2 type transport system permease protein